MLFSRWIFRRPWGGHRGSTHVYQDFGASYWVIHCACDLKYICSCLCNILPYYNLVVIF